MTILAHVGKYDLPFNANYDRDDDQIVQKNNSISLIYQEVCLCLIGSMKFRHYKRVLV